MPMPLKIKIPCRGFNADACMRKLSSLLVMACVLLLAMSPALATDTSSEGVNAIVKYDPLGPNNLIVAFVEFANNNAYSVRVVWKPLIKCEGSDTKEGYGEPFVMSKGGSYQVTIWRSTTCGNAKLDDLRAEMAVEKAPE